MSCVFKSKILWSSTVPALADSVAHNKAHPILKDKGIQLSWKKTAPHLVA